MTPLRMICSDMVRAQRSLESVARVERACSQPAAWPWQTPWFKSGDEIAHAYRVQRREVLRCGHMLAANFAAANDEAAPPNAA